jgi:hypothetical protein
MSLLCDLDDEVHMSAYAWQGNGWRRSRQQKQWLITAGRDRYPVSAYMLAVVELQRFWRGILLRRRVLKKYIAASFTRAWKHEEQLVMSAYRATPRAPEAAFGELVKRVQAQWRTALLRAEFSRWENLQRWPVYWVAAATIQRAWVDFQYHRNLKRHRNRSKRIYKTKTDHAAGKIQHLWKGYIHKRIFKFFVALLKFREQGDPSLMLKCIDPGEAAMMDKAAGLHVRFRLGGTHFPPLILYKVFTHNNVADVGSFAPRDYATRRKETQKQTPAVLHNTTHTPLPDKRQNWYQRVDNNYWRPVDVHTLKNAEEIAYLMQTQATKHADIIPQGAAFHYSRLKRQKDKEIKQKQTRRLWLAELYSSEQCRHRPTYEHETVKYESNKIFFTMDEAEVEDEVQRLTDWTDQLDFEAYRRDWLRQGTTAGSDTKLLALDM